MKHICEILVASCTTMYNVTRLYIRACTGVSDGARELRGVPLYIGVGGRGVDGGWPLFREGCTHGSDTAKLRNARCQEDT